jgi:hypothetical protein
MAFPLVPSRSSRERVKSLAEVLRKFGSNKHARFMLRMRLSLDCGCVTVATQGGPDNRFTVESPAPFRPGYNLKDASIHRAPMLLDAKLSEERKESDLGRNLKKTRPQASKD